MGFFNTKTETVEETGPWAICVANGRVLTEEQRRSRYHAERSYPHYSSGYAYDPGRWFTSSNKELIDAIRKEFVVKELKRQEETAERERKRLEDLKKEYTSLL